MNMMQHVKFIKIFDAVELQNGQKAYAFNKLDISCKIIESLELESEKNSKASSE